MFMASNLWELSLTETIDAAAETRMSCYQEFILPTSEHERERKRCFIAWAYTGLQNVQLFDPTGEETLHLCLLPHEVEIPIYLSIIFEFATESSPNAISKVARER